MLLDKVISPFKEFGLFGGLVYGLDRVLARTGAGAGIYYYELMVQSVADKPLVSPKIRQLVQVRQLQSDDPVVEQLDLTKDVLDFRFGQDAVCLGAFQKDQPIGNMWFCVDRYEEDEVRCSFVTLPAGEGVFDFGFYIRPEHRLGLAFVALWDYANEYLRERGIRNSFSRVSRFNLISRTVHSHLKWRRLGRVLFLRLPGLQLMLATVSPYIHVSFRHSSGPVISLRA